MHQVKRYPKSWGSGTRWPPHSGHYKSKESSKQKATVPGRGNKILAKNNVTFNFMFRETTNLVGHLHIAMHCMDLLLLTHISTGPLTSPWSVHPTRTLCLNFLDPWFLQWATAVCTAFLPTEAKNSITGCHEPRENLRQSFNIQKLVYQLPVHCTPPINSYHIGGQPGPGKAHVILLLRHGNRTHAGYVSAQCQEAGRNLQ